ncbi:ferredoxin [Candidatus Uhrbacteria bacterium]|jgi:ferredoxin|nr:ferredoxin [Candidatus Uhrbacteria bacterium]MBT7717153.1 ferredoxin [Candidatus Uhrbacteria bacterium]
MKITIKVDPDLCIGAASCVAIDDSSFEMNDENKAYVLDHGKAADESKYEREVEVTQEELDRVLMAAQSCPTLAVIVTGEDGKQLYPEV